MKSSAGDFETGGFGAGSFEAGGFGAGGFGADGGMWKGAEHCRRSEGVSLRGAWSTKKVVMKGDDGEVGNREWAREGGEKSFVPKVRKTPLD